MPDQKNSFQMERTKLYIQRTRAIVDEFPAFAAAYFRNIEPTTSPLTRYAYAIDLRGFFEFLVTGLDLFPDRDIPSLTIEDLKKLHPVHIDMYLEQMTLYEKDERELSNQERAKARKIAALRSFFKYFFKSQQLPSNIAALIDTPKLHERAIIRLEPNEVANLLDLAEDGSGLTDRQKQYHEMTKIRDVAILTLFLGTGIRISELVGLDLEDIDFENEAFIVTRKGGKEDILNFGTEVSESLRNYMQKRISMEALSGHEKALFLSMQRRRITARAVENLVKKYAKLAAPLKKITPHKLRSTYGTMLYHETQDIYLVADVLGHRDVNTTRKHYAASSEDHKRIAAKRIHLRKD